VATLERRSGYIFGIFMILLVVAAGRAAYLGVVRASALRKVASAEHVSTEAIIPPRGTITDRSGVDLAVSEPAREVFADPDRMSNVLADSQKLAPLLGISEAAVLHKLSEHTGFVYLARSMPAVTAEKILAMQIPEIGTTPVMRRVYPQGALAGQVLGVVGTEGQGLAGIEYSRNKQLRGRTGARRVVRDAIGQPVSISEASTEQPGQPIALTIDANIQQRTEDVLGAVSQAFTPKDATAIVMDPRTGAILALANWPKFNPGQPSLSSSSDIQDRAVGFAYEPGSTFKAFTVSGAMEQGLITPSTPFNIPDQIQVADRTIHDDTEHPEETLTTSQILARSSNVGAIKIGALEGASKFNEWVHRFGFGSPTNVELPGEEAGVLLPLDKYSGSSMGNLPIGQGELVTPMQMATAYSAIANGGILRSPHILSSIGGVKQPLPAGHRIISTSTAAAVRHMLEGVLAPGGTAAEVSIPGYALAGKTGSASKVDPATGEYSQSAFVASFIGMAPASNPRLLCAVVVDEPHSGSIYGGRVAAPAFGEIMSYALSYLGIPPG
jgi:cell division protein FtsI (penicillin-binding protein 3)